jgi:hypothetical protein
MEGLSAGITRLADQTSSIAAAAREATAPLRDVARLSAGISGLSDWEKIRATIKPNPISADLFRSLQREASANSALLDSIRRVESSAKHLPFATKPLQIPKMPPPPILETNRRLNDINEQLAAMRQMAVEMAKTVSAVSDTSSQFVRDFAAASTDANRASKTAAWLALIGILAAAGQIFYAAYTDHQKDPESKAAIAVITTKIEALSELVGERGGIAHQDAEKLRAALHEISTNLLADSPRRSAPQRPTPRK